MLLLVCVVSMSTAADTSLVAVPPASEHVLHSWGESLGQAHITILVAKIGESEGKSTYTVTVGLSRVSGAWCYLAVDLAMWAPQDSHIALLDYEPVTTALAAELRLAPPMLSLEEGAGGGGQWRSTPVDKLVNEWAVALVSCERVFEVSFCWDKILAAAAWSVDTGVDAFIDVRVEYSTSSGSCEVRRPEQETTVRYYRVELWETAELGN